MLYNICITSIIFALNPHLEINTMQLGKNVYEIAKNKIVIPSIYMIKHVINF